MIKGIGNKKIETIIRIIISIIIMYNNT